MSELFRGFASRAARVLGSPWAFSIALIIIAAWVLSGPLFGFSDTWQLIINTSTTIVTFLMVFMIQNTQNRDSDALQIKLDEIIRAMSGARSDLIDLEDLSEEQIERLKRQFADMGSRERTNGSEPDA